MSEKDGLDAQQAQIDRERYEVDQANIDAGLKHLMSAATGRAWMWDLLGRCGMFSTSVNVDHPNTDAVTNFREGSRNVSLMIWNDLQELCPDDTIRMQREGIEIQATRNAVDAKRSKKRRRKRNRDNARRDDNDSAE